jgi:hypothetical protein
VRRVRRADFLTIETPVAKPSSARHHAQSFHLRRCSDLRSHF